MKLAAVFAVLLGVSYLQTASSSSPICSDDKQLYFRTWNRVAKGKFRGEVTVTLAENDPITVPAAKEAGNQTYQLGNVMKNTKLTVSGYADKKFTTCVLELGERLGKILACRKDGHRSAIFRYFCKKE